MLLTQRTNILLNEADYKMLKELSKKNSQTVGELIRHAITKTYQESRPSRAQLFKKFKELAKKVDLGGLDYKELRDYGRK